MVNAKIEGISVILEIILTLIISLMILLYYMESSSDISYLVVIFISFFLGFVGITLFPIDIGLSNQGESASTGFIILWYIIYLGTCFLSWVYLPVMSNYWASGEFFKGSRIKEAIRTYVQSYIFLGIVCIIVCCYLIFSKTSTFSTLVSITMALINTYGMCFIVVYLGYGLAAVPLSLIGRLYPQEELNDLYIKALELDEDKFDYEMQVVSVKCNVYELLNQMKKANKSSELITTATSILESMPDDEDIDLKRHQKGHIDQSQWITVSDEEMNVISDSKLMKKLSRLNSRSKHVCLVYQRRIRQYDEIVISIAKMRHISGSSEIPLETNHSMNDSFYYKYTRLFITFRKPLYIVAIVLSILLSAITLFNELTTFIYQLTGKRCSPLSWAYFLNGSSTLRVIFGTVSLVYISICFFYGFFNLSIPLFNVYHMYPHYTDVYTLGYNACYLCRYQFSLFYHYFTLFQLPSSAYQEIALSVVMGPIQTIPFLGYEFNNFIPIFVILMTVVTLLRLIVKGKKKRRMQEKKEDDEEEGGRKEEDNKIKEGKKIIDITLKKRGYSTEDVEKQISKKKLYYYKEVKYVK